jgi:Protein of unknown function (DUF3311)
LKRFRLTSAGQRVELPLLWRVFAATEGRAMATNDTQRARNWSWWYLLLLLQFVPTLWVPLYNSVEPAWHGIPFFYWFQMAMIFVGAIVTAFVYFATDR